MGMQKTNSFQNKSGNLICCQDVAKTTLKNAQEIDLRIYKIAD